MSAVLNTLIYSDLFSYPLKKEEIWRFLIEEKFEKKQVLKKLVQLEEKGVIEKKDDFYFLKGKSVLINQRIEREKEALKKIKKIRKLLKFLKKIPFLKAVALTGGVAAGNVDKKDDIDLMIITQKNRLWLARFFLVLLLEFLGKRRRPKSNNVQDKICLNIFLDEDHLKIPEKKQNLFTSFEINQLKFLWQKKGIKEKFFWENHWIKKYLPNLVKSLNLRPELRSRELEVKSDKKKNKKFTSLYSKFSILNSLEIFSYKLQLKYMKPHKAQEQVSLHTAFFHPEDKALTFLKKFYQASKRERFRV